MARREWRGVRGQEGLVSESINGSYHSFTDGLRVTSWKGLPLQGCGKRETTATQIKKLATNCDILLLQETHEGVGDIRALQEAIVGETNMFNSLCEGETEENEEHACEINEEEKCSRWLKARNAKMQEV